jgi:hypothetical protein
MSHCVKHRYDSTCTFTYVTWIWEILGLNFDGKTGLVDVNSGFVLYSRGSRFESQPGCLSEDFFIILNGAGLGPLGTAVTVAPATDDRWWWLWSSWWNEDCQGKLKCSEKICPNATLSTTNPTWPDPGRRGGKPATKHLSYGTAYRRIVVVFFSLGKWQYSALNVPQPCRGAAADVSR